MNRKILIFGSRGWLANKFAKFIPNAKLSSVDISDPCEVGSALDSIKPDVVINGAGKTGRPNIDWCEVNRYETHRSNVSGPLTLANACLKRGIYLVHLSSGCIFNGESPFPGGWTETDVPNPVSYYSETKVQAESYLLNTNGRILIVRLRMPVDREPNQRNLITKLVAYPKVIDVVNSVTVVEDLLQATVQLIEGDYIGVFNVVNPIPVRHSEIMEWYQELVDLHHQYEMIPLDELYRQGLAKARRSNCILNTEKLVNAGVQLPDAVTRIRECLKKYKNHVKPLP